MMYSSRTRVAAVTASLVFALSGGVAFADEAANVQQGTAQQTTQEQVTTGEQPAQEQTATDGEATNAQDAVGQTATSGGSTADPSTDQTKDGTEAVQTSDETKSDESKAGETDAQKTTEAGAQEAAGTADAKDATNSAEATTATDDVALEPQVAEFYKSTYNRNTRSSNVELIDESSIEWATVDVSEFSSDKYRYVDEDGYRTYYKISNAWKLEGTEEAVKYERAVARVKIAENGEFLAPTTSAGTKHASFFLATDHTTGQLPTAERYDKWPFVGTYMDADVPQDAFTKSYVDKYGETAYYYPGGEYGPAGYYYKVSSENYWTRNADARYAGMYWHFDTEGGSPFSGTSARVESKTGPSFVAAVDGYESGTATMTPATGTDYVSPTAAEATPATSDATSIAGVVAAAVSAIGALGLGKAIRRK